MTPSCTPFRAWTRISAGSIGAGPMTRPPHRDLGLADRCGHDLGRPRSTFGQPSAKGLGAGPMRRPPHRAQVLGHARTRSGAMRRPPHRAQVGPGPDPELPRLTFVNQWRLPKLLRSMQILEVRSCRFGGSRERRGTSHAVRSRTSVRRRGPSAPGAARHWRAAAAGRNARPAPSPAQPGCPGGWRRAPLAEDAASAARVLPAGARQRLTSGIGRRRRPRGPRRPCP